MGYTPDEERLEEPIRQLEEALIRARETMMARIRSNTYTEEHMTKLTDLVLELTELEIKLIKLRQ